MGNFGPLFANLSPAPSPKPTESRKMEAGDIIILDGRPARINWIVWVTGALHHCGVTFAPPGIEHAIWAVRIRLNGESNPISPALSHLSEEDMIAGRDDYAEVLRRNQPGGAA